MFRPVSFAGEAVVGEKYFMRRLLQLPDSCLQVPSIDYSSVISIDAL